MNPYVSGTDWAYVGFDALDRIILYNWNSPTDYGKIYSALAQDATDWFNVHAIIDTTNPNSEDRQQLWINGVRLVDVSKDYASFALNYYPLTNSPYTHQIGYNPDAGQYSDFYLSDYYFIDGEVLLPTDFGELVNGKWIPKEPVTLNYGNNGFHLDFSDVNDLGKDVSGNNNHFTSSNLTSEDQVLDNPMNNFCVLNPKDSVGGTLSEGNLKVVTINAEGRGRGTMIIPPSKKIYFEVTLSNLSNAPFAVGFRRADDSISTTWSQSYDRIFITRPGHQTNGTVWDGSSWSASYGTPAQGDVIGIAVYDNKLWISINGTWVNGGDPEAGTGYVLDNLPIDIMPCWYDEASSASGTFYFNFGQDPALGNGFSDSNGYGNFAYTPPAGFLALCWSNLYGALGGATASISSDTNSVAPGGAATLTWDSSNADTVTISPALPSACPITPNQPGSCTVDVNTPPVTYKITAAKAGYTDVIDTVTIDSDGTGCCQYINGDLTVNGVVTAKEIVVTDQGWPDYVFDNNYAIWPLDRLEHYIGQNHHLPGIPDASDIASVGMPVSKMLNRQMQKIEELTLYLIELKKENDELKRRISLIESGSTPE